MGIDLFVGFIEMLVIVDEDGCDGEFVVIDLLG